MSSEAPIRLAGVILHREGRVLLQHRDDDRPIPSPGMWAIFGGQVEEGETPEQGAIREIDEELGLRLEPPLRLVYRGRTGDRERFYFLSALLNDPATLTLHEGQGMALLAPEDLDQYTIVPLHREVLRSCQSEWTASEKPLERWE